LVTRENTRLKMLLVALASLDIFFTFTLPGSKSYKDGDNMPTRQGLDSSRRDVRCGVHRHRNLSQPRPRQGSLLLLSEAYFFSPVNLLAGRMYLAGKHRTKPHIGLFPEEPKREYDDEKDQFGQVSPIMHHNSGFLPGSHHTLVDAGHYATIRFTCSGADAGRGIGDIGQRVYVHNFAEATMQSYTQENDSEADVKIGPVGECLQADHRPGKEATREDEVNMNDAM